MDELRRPLFLVAVVMIVLALLVELGSSFVIGGGDATADLRASAAERDIDIDVEQGEVDEPPGLAIPYLALVDGILVFTMLLMVGSLVLPDRLHGRLQGIVTLIFSILLIFGGLILLIIAFIALLVMVSLFLAPPFGTIAYLALWGYFPRGDANLILSLLMLLKLAFAAFLILAHQRFLQNKGLVILVLISLVLNIVVSFLHGIVPIILVSITDAIGAILNAIVAIIWGIVLLIGAIVSIVKAIRSTVSIAGEG